MSVRDQAIAAGKAAQQIEAVKTPEPPCVKHAWFYLDHETRQCKKCHLVEAKRKAYDPAELRRVAEQNDGSGRTVRVDIPSEILLALLQDLALTGNVIMAAKAMRKSTFGSNEKSEAFDAALEESENWYATDNR